MTRKLALVVVVVASSARAQPVTPLAEIRDDQQLADVLAEITQDPAIEVDDPNTRELAQALLIEGVKRLQIQAYDQALANFLEAYDRFPSPKILLDIASTLRDMGRIADAANSYRRYLADPAPGPARVAEVTALLQKLDAQLAILTVHVSPRGSELSIDAGPFVPVGGSLQLRVRPGTHSIRIRAGTAMAQLDINTFEGATKDVSATLQVELPAPPSGAKPAEQVNGWLIDGRTYATANVAGRERHVRSTLSGDEIKAFVPSSALDDDDDDRLPPEETTEVTIGSGVVAIMRIDGNHWRGFAGGLGLAYAASDPIEIEVAGLKSDIWGAYLGARYRFLTGWLRPYAAAGLPMFFFKDDSGQSQVGLGGRIAGGIELELNGHLSLEGDLGIEHFFNIGGVIYKMQTFEDTAFTPTLGVIGRL